MSFFFDTAVKPPLKEVVVTDEVRSTNGQ